MGRLPAPPRPSANGLRSLEQAAIDQQAVLRIHQQLVAGAGDALGGTVMENLRVGHRSILQLKISIALRARHSAPFPLSGKRFDCHHLRESINASAYAMERSLEPDANQDDIYASTANGKKSALPKVPTSWRKSISRQAATKTASLSGPALEGSIKSLPGSLRNALYTGHSARTVGLGDCGEKHRRPTEQGSAMKLRARIVPSGKRITSLDRA